MKNPWHLNSAGPAPAKEMFSKPESVAVPHYQAPTHNYALNQMTHADGNPIHTAHLEKALQLKSPKTHFNQPHAGAPGTGSPWLEIAGGKK